mmetsp:Transcript_13133/g.24156  ORF Transcript_13133/g.24156 Transcript_13133/m.24156 type:complete len:310 (+) Transcript_13133:254-1183(+)
MTLLDTPHVQISLVETHEDILSLTDLRYQEWMSEDPNPPNLSSFRLATAEIFHESVEEGSMVFLASMLSNGSADGHGIDDGMKKYVTVGAAELSPIELKGVFIGNENSKSSNAHNEAMSLYITDVVTSSAYRRHGIGSKVMNAVEQNALKMGARFLFLHVEHDNIGARKFYERLGYKDVDIKSRKGREDSEEDGIISFSLEDRELSTTLQATTTINRKDLIAMDVTRLAVNAGAVGQLLMMKQMSEPTLRDGYIATAQSSSCSTQASTKVPTTDSSALVGVEFGKQNVNQGRKKRKRLTIISNIWGIKL